MCTQNFKDIKGSLKIQGKVPQGEDFSRNDSKPYKFNKNILGMRGLLLFSPSSFALDKMGKKEYGLLIYNIKYFGGDFYSHHFKVSRNGKF